MSPGSRALGLFILFSAMAACTKPGVNAPGGEGVEVEQDDREQVTAQQDARATTPVAQADNLKTGKEPAIMATTASTQALPAFVQYSVPPGWRELPGSPAAIEDAGWKTWGRGYLGVVGLNSTRLTFDSAGEPEEERLRYPLNVIHAELSALWTAIGGRASLHAFGSGAAAARLYVVVPAQTLAEKERVAVTDAIMQWLGDRYEGVGSLGPNQDVAYFEVEVVYDSEGGYAVVLIWPGSRMLAYARARKHEDAVTALAGLQLAGYPVDIREALAGD